MHKALFALLEGRFAEAEVLSASALEVGGRAQNWDARVCHTLQMFVLRRDQGRLREIEVLVRRVAGENPTYPILHCARTLMVTELGNVTEARESLAALVGHLPFDEEWLLGMGFLAETVHALQDTESAGVIYEAMRAYPDRVAIGLPEVSTGSVARPLGLMATVLARWDDAERHFETALEVNRRIGARSWLAHTQRDYAQMLSRRDALGDAERARRLTARRGRPTASWGSPTELERHWPRDARDGLAARRCPSVIDTPGDARGRAIEPDLPLDVGWINGHSDR